MDTSKHIRRTLLVFLENQGRHLATAEALYMHRNTVAQRHTTGVCQPAAR